MAGALLQGLLAPVSGAGPTDRNWGPALTLGVSDGVTGETVCGRHWALGLCSRHHHCRKNHPRSSSGVLRARPEWAELLNGVTL